MRLTTNPNTEDLPREKAAILVELQRASADVSKPKAIKCPWHEDRHPSAEVYQGDDGVWRFRCHGCGAGADFHALRHTYISNIVNGGAPIKATQELARNSSPTLTVGVYTHVRLHDLTHALEALPSVDTTPASGPQRMQATGTYDHRENQVERGPTALRDTPDGNLAPPKIPQQSGRE